MRFKRSEGQRAFSGVKMKAKLYVFYVMTHRNSTNIISIKKTFFMAVSQAYVIRMITVLVSGYTLWFTLQKHIPYTVFSVVFNTDVSLTSVI